MPIIPNCLEELLKINVSKLFYKYCINENTAKYKINAQVKWQHVFGDRALWKMVGKSVSSPF